MIYTVLDAETTSKYPNSAMPVAVSYVSYDDNLARTASGILYFYDDSIPESDPGAIAVHGLNKSKLMQYKDDFETNVRKLYKLLWRGNVVGYNSDRFDIPVLTHFLAKQGIVEQDKYGMAKDFLIERKIDIYKVVKPILPGRITESGRKGGKQLCDAAEYFDIKPEQMAMLYRAYFGKTPTDSGFHSAEYDTFVTAMLFCKLAKEGYIKL